MQRFIKTAFAAALVSIAASAFAANTATTPTVKVSPEEQAKIEQTVQQYLMRKPEVIVEALQSMQKKQYEQAQQTMKQTEQTASKFATPLFHTPNDPIAGNPAGTVTVVEFFDYQCSHCISMAPIVSAIIKANPNVRVVFKEFPIRGPISEYAARAALAANKQGKYVELSHAILAAASSQPLTQEAILQMAKTAGLNIDQLKKDMNDKAVDEQLKANIKLAQDLKLFGTPALFIGKTSASGQDTINYIPGEVTQAQLQDLLDKTK